MEEDPEKYGDEGMVRGDYTNLTRKHMNVSVSLFNEMKLKADHKLLER